MPGTDQKHILHDRASCAVNAERRCDGGLLGDWRLRDCNQPIKAAFGGD
jgi:hypothetical protein